MRVIHRIWKWLTAKNDCTCEKIFLVMFNGDGRTATKTCLECGKVKTVPCIGGEVK